MDRLVPALPSDSSFLLPQVVAEELGEDGLAALADYFGGTISNENTRHAYLRAVMRFFGSLPEAGLELSQLRPVHVGAYVTHLERPQADGGAGYAVATVKQHLAAIRMLCSFLVVRQILKRNPALEVRGPKHVVRVGKTPVLSAEDARALFASIDPATPGGARDRALLGVMVYSFARIGAVTALDVSDYFQVGRKMVFRLQEKGGKQHEMPAHHTLIDYMDAYLQALGEGQGPLFRTINRKRTGFTENRLNRREALAMVKRRCKAAGLGERFSNHTLRATGITAYLANGGDLDQAQLMAAHASPSTTKLYDRRGQEASLDEVERIRL